MTHKQAKTKPVIKLEKPIINLTQFSQLIKFKRFYVCEIRERQLMLVSVVSKFEVVQRIVPVPPGEIAPYFGPAENSNLIGKK